jgi:L-ascorbate metabolism protein UlaG (beta-lactamase superfamily)
MDGRPAFFGASTLLIPELAEVARQFSEIDLVLPPINGLQIRPRFNRQVVMDAEEAASLAGTLPAGTAVPIHYAPTGGKVDDRMLLKHDGRPELFRDAATALAPQTTVRVLPPGEPLQI